LVRYGGAPNPKSAATRLVFPFDEKLLPVIFAGFMKTLVVKISDTSHQEPAHLRAVELASRGRA